MEKKELLDLIDQDSSFMKAFLDEYRQDGVNFGAEDRLMSLFVGAPDKPCGGLCRC